MKIGARNHCYQATGVLQQSHGEHRLPCRGCTRDCKNYPYCNGTPWRSDWHATDNRQYSALPG